ncbi:MAG: ATP-binding protein [Cyanobacteria bacterium P01_A01_bin.3]
MIGAGATVQFKSLLIVDDCGEDRSAYKHYLAKDPRQSYQILEADCAEDAFALLRERPVDLILLDFKLPEMDGMEFLEVLGTEFPRIPVIFLTAYGNEEIAVKAMKKGVSDYLSKSTLTPEILQMAVRNAIEQARLQQSLERTRDRQRLIASTSLLIRHSLDREEILSTAVEQVARLLGSDRAIVCQLDAEGGSTVVAESVKAEWQSMLGCTRKQLSLPIGEGGESWRHYHQSIANVKTAALSAADRDFLRTFDVQASMSVPIVVSKPGENSCELSPSSPWGVLIVHQCSSTRQWHPEEFDTLNELSVQLAIAIQQSELLARTQRSLEEEQSLNAFKSKIIGTVSHEFRTPITGILTAASTLKQHGERLEPNMRERCLQIVEQRARHLACLVDDMLFASQSQTEAEMFQPCLLDPEYFFSEIIAERRVAASTNHHLELNILDNTEGFWGDRNVLRQLFGNLLSNAIKYSPHGGAIEIGVSGSGDRVSVTISDNGIGIPKTDVQTLFQSFSRGSNVGTISGTGLGMAIVKSCVDMHDGEISIDTKEGKGTRVVVELPKQASSIVMEAVEPLEEEAIAS